jgi:hypothetical protein
MNSQVEISPCYYRQGDVTAYFRKAGRKGGRFSVTVRGAEVGGSHDHGSYRAVLEDLAKDESLTDEDRSDILIILDTMKRSLYDQYVVINEEDV